MNWGLYANLLRRVQAVPQPDSLSGRFAWAMDFLRRLAANFANASEQTGPFMRLIDDRLARLAKRFNTLALKFEAGTLLPPPKPRARPKPTTPARPRRPGVSLNLPSRRGWLVHWVQLVNQASIERYIADPRMQELAAAAPQAGRILRPLCHMLAIPCPDFLRPKPPAAKTIDAKTIDAKAIAVTTKTPAAKTPAAKTRRLKPRPSEPRQPPGPHPFRDIPALRHLWDPIRRPQTA